MTSRMEPVRILSELSLKRPFQFWWLSILPLPMWVKELLDLGVGNRVSHADPLHVTDRNEHRSVAGRHAQRVKAASRAENRLLFYSLDDT